MAPSASADPSKPATGVGEPSFAEHVCLALVVEGVSHGWALGSLLAPAGELGRIWTLSRALTYRAVDQLVARGLVAREGRVSGQGRDRVALGATASGREVAARWLDTPVAHLRDVRTQLLVKLALRERAGLDVDSLLVAQQARFATAIDALTTGTPDDDLVGVWRRESARAVRRFLDQARPANRRPPPGRELRLSARNQLRATVVAVQHGDVMSMIKAVLCDGQHLTAAITRDAADELDLAPDDAVVVIVKSTEVMVAKTP